MNKRDYRILSQMEWENYPFPIVQYDFRIFFTEAVFDQISGVANTTREVGGILVGEVYSDDGGPFAMVDGIIDALHARESETELTITYETWEHVHREMDANYAGKRIMGWYHTHPGFGIFLSEQDEFIHKNFFDQPYQIALVYDPIKREHGLFVWYDNLLWRSRRYWIGGSEHNWDGPRERDHKEQILSDLKMTSALATSQALPVPSKTVQQPNQVEEFFSLPGQTVLLVGLLMMLFLGGYTGFQLARYQSSMEARAQGAQEAVVSLNTDLLDVLKSSLGDESLNSNLDTLQSHLSETKDSLAKSAATKPELNSIVQELSKAINDLQQARQERHVASQMFEKLGQIVQTAPESLKVAQRDLLAHRNAIGKLYLELATIEIRANQSDRALALLAEAVRLDPDNRAVYEAQMNAINPDANRRDGN